MASYRLTPARTGRLRGFTVMELLVTLAVLGVLASLAVPAVQVVRQRSQEQELRLALREIRGAIDAYKRASDEGRIAKPIGASGFPPNLDILVDGMPDLRDLRHDKIHFLRHLPRNPMNSDPGIADATSWALRCYASGADDPQEGDDVYDVYVTSSAVGLDGVPYGKW